MNGTQTHALPSQPVRSHVLRWLASSSVLEASGAIAVIALAVVGLGGIFSATMAGIATIVLGVAVLSEGGTLRAISEAYSARGIGEVRNFETPVGLDFMGGIAAVVLGILALLGPDVQTLLSVAVIVLGASFLFSEQFMVGLGGVVLGILAVIGIAPVTLILVGLLAFGVGSLIGGATLATHSTTTQPGS